MGWREVNLNLDNVFKYTVCFFGEYPLLPYLVVLTPLSVMVGQAWPSVQRHLGLTIYSPGLAVMSLQNWVALQGGSCDNHSSKEFLSYCLTYR